jgi:hypothetical protein
LLVYVFWACVLFGCAVAFVHERLRTDKDHSFFARGAGIREDWEAMIGDTEDLYLGSGRTKAGEGIVREDAPT